MRAITRARFGSRRVVACACAGVVLVALTAASSGCRAPDRQARGMRVESFVVQADQLIREGREDEALALLALAIERNPTLTTAHLRMGELYRGRGSYRAALVAYERAAETDPLNFDAHYGLGLMLHLVERYADAARAYLRAVELRPDDFKSNLNLAIAYLELGETRPAASFAVRAVALDPTSGEARATLASAYSEMQLHSDAVREYQAASELMDLRPDLLINMATSLGKLGRYQEMANTLRTVLRLRPSAAAHERLGFAMFKLRRYAEALEQFRRAIDIDPGHYPALNGLGVTLLNQYLRSDKTDIDARDEALSALRRSLRINDRQPRILELVTRYG